MCDGPSNHIQVISVLSPLTRVEPTSLQTQFATSASDCRRGPQGNVAQACGESRKTMWKSLDAAQSCGEHHVQVFGERIFTVPLLPPILVHDDDVFSGPT